MKEIKMWLIRNFKVISISEAKKYKLKFLTNIYGDSISKLNCRSIWVDDLGRNYKVKELMN